MPYSLRKAPRKNLYWVIGPGGKHHSKDPLPKERAEAQRRALYAAEGGYTMRGRKLRGGADPRLQLQARIRHYEQERDQLEDDIQAAYEEGAPYEFIDDLQRRLDNYREGLEDMEAELERLNAVGVNGQQQNEDAAGGMEEISFAPEAPTEEDDAEQKEGEDEDVVERGLLEAARQLDIRRREVGAQNAADAAAARAREEVEAAQAAANQPPNAGNLLGLFLPPHLFNNPDFDGMGRYRGGADEEEEQRRIQRQRERGRRAGIGPDIPGHAAQLAAALAAAHNVPVAAAAAQQPVVREQNVKKSPPKPNRRNGNGRLRGGMDGGPAAGGMGDDDRDIDYGSPEQSNISVSEFFDILIEDLATNGEMFEDALLKQVETKFGTPELIDDDGKLIRERAIYIVPYLNKIIAGDPVDSLDDNLLDYRPQDLLKPVEKLIKQSKVYDFLKPFRARLLKQINKNVNRNAAGGMEDSVAPEATGEGRYRRRRLRGGDVGADIADVERNVILPQFNKFVPGLGTGLQMAGDALTNLFTDQGAVNAENARLAAIAAQQAQNAADRAAYEQSMATDPNANLKYSLGLAPDASQQQIRRAALGGMGKGALAHRRFHAEEYIC